jgi:hypothetical protein
MPHIHVHVHGTTPTRDASVEETMHEFKRGQLHSGSSNGPKVRSRKQAVAIALNQAGKSNHDAVKHDPKTGQFAAGAGAGSKPTKIHHPDVESHYKELRAKTTQELHKQHRGLSRITSVYKPAEVGGKSGMISDILRHKHGNKKIAEHFGLSK